jgi:hypothetical protein
MGSAHKKGDLGVTRRSQRGRDSGDTEFTIELSERESPSGCPTPVIA